MKLSQREVAGVTILEPRGKITIGNGDAELRDSIERALDAGNRRILIDLKAITKLDSSGLAELVAARSRAAGRGAEIKLVNLPPKVQDILGITQVVTLFDVFDDEQEALASYG